MHLTITIERLASLEVACKLFGVAIFSIMPAGEGRLEVGVTVIGRITKMSSEQFICLKHFESK